MGPGASSSDELVADAARERQIGDGSVQMTELSTTEPEFNPAEAVFVCRDALPARDRGAHRVDRRVRGHDFAGHWSSPFNFLQASPAGICDDAGHGRFNRYL